MFTVHKKTLKRTINGALCVVPYYVVNAKKKRYICKGLLKNTSRLSKAGAARQRNTNTVS